MELNKENMKKIRWLIAFSVLLYLGVQNLDVVLKYVKIVWGLLLPFVLGGAMAFVLNVPMAFIERHVFGKAKEKEDRRGRAAAKFARPVSLAMNFAIGFVFSCYVLLQKEKLGRQVLKAAYAILPVKTVEYLGHVCTLASKVFSSFITGQCIEAVILGSMFFVSMTIGRFPYAMLIGVLISFTALIPVFGGIIGCWVGFFLILMVSPLKALAFLILFLILQQIEGNLIYPHVVGNSVGLPAIWVLVAVTLGGNLMGIVGMLIFIPLVSVIYTLFKEWVSERLEQKKVKIS